MASKTNKKAEQKQKMVRIVAVVACAALLLTACNTIDLLVSADHIARTVLPRKRAK